MAWHRPSASSNVLGCGQEYGLRLRPDGPMGTGGASGTNIRMVLSREPMSGQGYAHWLRDRSAPSSCGPVTSSTKATPRHADIRMYEVRKAGIASMAGDLWMRPKSGHPKIPTRVWRSTKLHRAKGRVKERRTRYSTTKPRKKP